MPTTFVDAGTVTAILDLGSATPGKVPVMATNPDGKSSGTVEFEVLGLVPGVSSITPTAIPSNCGSLEIQIVGKNFLRGAVVRLGTFAAAINRFVSSTKLSASFDLKFISQGTYQLTVANPTGERSKGLKFLVGPPSPPPVLTGVFPRAVGGDARTLVRVLGQGLSPASSLLVDGKVNKAAYVSARTLTTQLDTVGKATGSLDLKVVGPCKQQSSSIKVPLLPPGAPEARALSPTQLDLDAAKEVVVYGSGFVAASRVLVGGTSVAVEYLTAGMLRIKSRKWSTKGVLPITVENPGSKLSRALYIAVVDTSLPTRISALDPAAIDRGTSINGLLHVFGTGIDPSKHQASFLGQDLDLKASSARPTGWFYVTPPKTEGVAAGMYRFSIKGKGGGALSNELPFVVRSPADAGAAPVVTGVSPSRVPTGKSNVPVILSGRYFSASAQVQFNGKTVAAVAKAGSWPEFQVKVEIKTDGLKPGSYPLQVIHPPAHSGGVPVKSNIYSLRLVDKPAPDIVWVLPQQGETGSAVAVYVYGDELFDQTGTSVYFDGQKAPLLEVSSTLPRLKVGLDLRGVAAGTYLLQIAAKDGSKGRGALFTVTPQAVVVPEVLQIRPEAVYAGTMETVTVYGRGFQPGAKVVVGGTTLTPASVSSTAIQLPARQYGSAGQSMAVQVRNPAAMVKGSLGLAVVAPGTARIRYLVMAQGTNAYWPPPVAGVYDVVVVGTNFDPGSVVLFDGAKIPTVAASNSLLGVSGAQLARIGYGDHTMQVQTGAGALSNIALLPLWPRMPLLTAVSPPGGAVGSGLVLDILGAYFTASAEVWIDGKRAPGAIVASDRRILVPLDLAGAQPGRLKVQVKQEGLESATVWFAVQ